MNEWLERTQELLISYAPRVAAAVLILVGGWIAAKIIVSVLRGTMRRVDLDETLTTFLANLGYMLLMAFVIVAALGKLGVDTTSFAAIIAAAGLAIGLALQGSLGNFASGVMLIALRPIKVDDFVEVGGMTGTVESIQVFATTLRTPDNKIIIVPNGSVTGGVIINYSAEGTRRIDMVFGIGYDDDIRQAKAILERLVQEDDRILADPAPQIAVSELADSSVNFVVRPWVKVEDYWDVNFDLTERVKMTFDAEGISIPYPQQDVHMHQVEAAA
ncbi:MAG: mechanosensitive ion channel domain-containing protein [Acidobacteriota bacterium]